jgi:hypothetical protein
MSHSSTINVPNNRQISRRTAVITQNLSTVGVQPWIIDLSSYQIDFIPTKMIIRQILYTNIAGTDNGIFLLRCNLAENNVAAIYYGIQGVSQSPETELNIFSYQRQVEFQLVPAISGSFGSGTNGAPTGLIALTLEFLRE